LVVKGGTLTVWYAEITGGIGTYKDTTVVINGGSLDGEYDISGSLTLNNVSIKSEEFVADTDITINGGKVDAVFAVDGELIISGEANVTINAESEIETLTINGGKVTIAEAAGEIGELVYTAGELTIYGGTYTTTEVARNYLAAGYILYQSGDSFVVAENNAENLTNYKSVAVLNGQIAYTSISAALTGSYVLGDNDHAKIVLVADVNEQIKFSTINAEIYLNGHTIHYSYENTITYSDGTTYTYTANAPVINGNNGVMKGYLAIYGGANKDDNTYGEIYNLSGTALYVQGTGTDASITLVLKNLNVRSGVSNLNYSG
jgi:hypothetical protein